MRPTRMPAALPLPIGLPDRPHTTDAASKGAPLATTHHPSLSSRAQSPEPKSNQPPRTALVRTKRPRPESDETALAHRRRMHKEDLDIIVSEPNHPDNFLQEVQESAQREMRQQQLQARVQKATTPADVGELRQLARQACQTAALGHWPEQEPVLHMTDFWGKSDLQALLLSKLDLCKAATAWQDAAEYVNAAHQAAHKLGLHPLPDILLPPSERLPNAAAQAQRLNIQAQVTQGLWKLKAQLQEWNPYRAATQPKVFNTAAGELRSALAQCHPHAPYLRDRPIEGFSVALGSIEALMKKDSRYQPLDPYTTFSEPPHQPKEGESAAALAKRTAEWTSARQYCIEEKERKLEMAQASRRELIHVALQLQQALSGTLQGPADQPAHQTGMPLPSAPAEIHDIAMQLQSINFCDPSASPMQTDLQTMQRSPMEVDAPSTPQDSRRSYKDSLASTAAAVSRCRPAIRPVVFSASRPAQGPSVPATQTNRADARPTSRTTSLRTEKAARRPLLRPATAPSLKARPTHRAPDLRRHALLNTRFIPPAIQAESAPVDRRATDAQIKQALESVAHFDKASRLELDATMSPLMDCAKALTVQAHAHAAIAAKGPAWQHHAHQLAAWQLVAQAHDASIATLARQGARLFTQPAREQAITDLQKSLQADLQLALEQMRIAAKSACEALFEACHPPAVHAATGTDSSCDYKTLARGCQDLLTQLQSCAQRKEPSPTDRYIPYCEALESMCTERQRTPTTGAEAFEMAACLKRAADLAFDLAQDAEKPTAKRLSLAYFAWSAKRYDAMTEGSNLQIAAVNKFMESIDSLMGQAQQRAEALSTIFLELLPSTPLPTKKIASASQEEPQDNPRAEATALPDADADADAELIKNILDAAAKMANHLSNIVTPPADAPEKLLAQNRQLLTHTRLREHQAATLGEIMSSIISIKNELSIADNGGQPKIAHKFAESLKSLSNVGRNLCKQFSHISNPPAEQSVNHETISNLVLEMQKSTDGLDAMALAMKTLGQLLRIRQDECSGLENQVPTHMKAFIRSQKVIRNKYLAVDSSLRKDKEKILYHATKDIHGDAFVSDMLDGYTNLLGARIQLDRSLIEFNSYKEFMEAQAEKSTILKKDIQIWIGIHNNIEGNLNLTMENMVALKFILGHSNPALRRPVVEARLAMPKIRAILNRLNDAPPQKPVHKQADAPSTSRTKSKTRGTK